MRSRSDRHVRTCASFVFSTRSVSPHFRFIRLHGIDVVRASRGYRLCKTTNIFTSTTVIQFPHPLTGCRTAGLPPTCSSREVTPGVLGLPPTSSMRSTISIAKHRLSGTPRPGRAAGSIVAAKSAIPLRSSGGMDRVERRGSTGRRYSDPSDRNDTQQSHLLPEGAVSFRRPL